MAAWIILGLVAFLVAVWAGERLDEKRKRKKQG